MDEILEITLFLAATLERLGVPYFIGGSLASSLHGLPRATQDVDVVAVLTPQHVPGLIQALQDSFYLDETAIHEAIRDHTSFNLIHLDTMLKADVFVVSEGDSVAQQAIRRRERYRITDEPPRDLQLASAEDSIVQKLAWYRSGGGVSERQWSDALGVLKVSGERLDFAYLHRAAASLGVEDLLETILAEAGIPAKDTNAT